MVVPGVSVKADDGLLEGVNGVVKDGDDVGDVGVPEGVPGDGGFEVEGGDVVGALVSAGVGEGIEGVDVGVDGPPTV
jgi:hypothetical protein